MNHLMKRKHQSITFDCSCFSSYSTTLINIGVGNCYSLADNTVKYIENHSNLQDPSMVFNGTDLKMH